MLNSRSHERRGFSGLVQVESPRFAQTEVWGSNLGEGGMFVQLSSHVDVGDRLALKFQLEGDTVHIDQAEVTWVRPFEPVSVDGLMPGVGVRFTLMTRSTQQRLREWSSRTMLDTAGPAPRFEELASDEVLNDVPVVPAAIDGLGLESAEEDAALHAAFSALVEPAMPAFAPDVETATASPFDIGPAAHPDEPAAHADEPAAHADEPAAHAEEQLAEDVASPSTWWSPPATPVTPRVFVLDGWSFALPGQPLQLNAVTIPPGLDMPSPVTASQIIEARTDLPRAAIPDAPVQTPPVTMNTALAAAAAEQDVDVHDAETIIPDMLSHTDDHDTLVLERAPVDLHGSSTNDDVLGAERYEKSIPPPVTPAKRSSMPWLAAAAAVCVAAAGAFAYTRPAAPDTTAKGATAQGAPRAGQNNTVPPPIRPVAALEAPLNGWASSAKSKPETAAKPAAHDQPKRETAPNRASEATTGEDALAATARATPVPVASTEGALPQKDMQPDAPSAKEPEPLARGQVRAASGRVSVGVRGGTIERRFALKNPLRVVVDLKDARYPGTRNIAVQKHGIREVRLGRPDRERVRVVIEFAPGQNPGGVAALKNADQLDITWR